MPVANLPAPGKGLSSLIEPLYAPGHVLMDDDLTAGVAYTRNLSRLLFRSIFGCGVICGLRVDPALDCGRLVITVQPGVALDCCGDPIEVRTPQAISVGTDCHDPIPSPLWVMIRRVQHACAPRELACPSDDEDDACGCHATRSRAGFELKVVEKPPRCACQCAKADDDDQPGKPTGDGPTRPTIPSQPGHLTVATPPSGNQILSRRRTEANDRLSAVTRSLVSAKAQLAAAMTRSDAADAALKAFNAQPAPAAGDAAATKAHEAELARLEAALKTAQDQKATLDTKVGDVTNEQTKAITDAAGIEQEWQAATAADAQAFHLMRDTPAALIAPRGCHADHYAGVCGCCCDGGCDGWVVLAKVTTPLDERRQPLDPVTDYRVRRFIRPVMAADPYWAEASGADD
jgi:hypothetical protein